MESRLFALKTWGFFSREIAELFFDLPFAPLRLCVKNQLINLGALGDLAFSKRGNKAC